MKPKVYLETSFIGYLSSGLHHDIVVAAHQKLSRRWWRGREQFSIFVSSAVEAELSHGDQTLATRRLRLISDLPRIEVTEEAVILAKKLVSRGPIPKKAHLDALHISLAMFHGLDFLLTWNCKHIANAAIQKKLQSMCASEGYKMPTICTPEQLMPT